MNKEAFLSALRQRLSGLPQEDSQERLAFYSEMIDDRIEEGIPEEEAVAAIGPVDEIARQIMAEIPLKKVVMHKVKPARSLPAWAIVLLIVGFPLWFPLLTAAFSVALSLYITIWSLVLTAYVVVLAFGASAIVCVPCAFYYLGVGKPAGAMFSAGAFLIMTGLTILAFLFSIVFTKGVIKGTGCIGLWIKSLFVGKGEPKHA